MKLLSLAGRLIDTKSFSLVLVQMFLSSSGQSDKEGGWWERACFDDNSTDSVDHHSPQTWLTNLKFEIINHPNPGQSSFLAFSLCSFYKGVFIAWQSPSSIQKPCDGFLWKSSRKRLSPSGKKKKKINNSTLTDCDFQDHVTLVCNKDMDVLTLKQEKGGLQAKHLKMASCLYFLRQGIDKL